MAIKIDRIDAGSEAEALGLQPGDELLSVDENELNDTLDYDFYTDSSSFHLKAKVADGIREWDVRRAERGPFGCDFSTYLGDQKHSCSNHCMFCFIDQLPPGMRESLYFKDDDERLSFLFGNYITMTNMQDHEIDRIIKMHISPINISVHTTNPQLRVRMLANKRGGRGAQVPAPSGGGRHRRQLSAGALPGHQRWRRASPHPGRPAGADPYGAEHCRCALWCDGLSPESVQADPL